MPNISSELCIVLEDDNESIILTFESEEDHDVAISLLTPFVDFAKKMYRMPKRADELLPVIAEGLKQPDYEEGWAIEISGDLINKFYMFYDIHNYYPESLTEVVKIFELFFEGRTAVKISFKYL